MGLEQRLVTTASLSSSPAALILLMLCESAEDVRPEEDHLSDLISSRVRTDKLITIWIRKRGMKEVKFLQGNLMLAKKKLKMT